MTLVEVVISIGVLGIVALAVASYFGWSLGVFKYTDVRATEESIARSEMELIKAMGYIEGATAYDTGKTYPGYSASNTVSSNISGTVGLQKVVVTVARDDAMAGSQSVTVAGYKLRR